MRTELKKEDGKRATFTGVFVRFGAKAGFNRRLFTILLRNIKDESGRIVAKHLWFNFTIAFARLNLKHGDRVQFDARVTEYVKGRYKTKKDYKLSRPTKVSRITTD